MTTIDATTTAVDVETHREIEQWLFREATILDNRDYDAWLDLLSPDIHYYMPLQENRLDRDRARDGQEPSLHTALFDDDLRFLRQRVRRINTGMAWNEEPPPRTRRFVTNIVTEADATSGRLKATSNFFIKRNRLHDDEDEFAGCRIDVLARDESGDLKLVDRTILLDQNVILTKSFSLIF